MKMTHKQTRVDKKNDREKIDPCSGLPGDKRTERMRIILFNA